MIQLTSIQFALILTVIALVMLAIGIASDNECIINISFIVILISLIFIALFQHFSTEMDVENNIKDLEHKYSAKIKEKMYSEIGANELEGIVKKIIKDNDYELRYLEYKKIENEQAEIVLEDRYRNKIEVIIVTNNLGKVSEIRLTVIPSNNASEIIQNTVKVKELRKYKDSEYAKDILEYVLDYIANGSEAIISK